MTLVGEITYVSMVSDVNSTSVLSMLHDVRKDIGDLDPDFSKKTLPEVVEVIESGQYEVMNGTLTRINLSSARGIVEAYRRGSEGGCMSCKNEQMIVVDAQDRDCFWFCKVHEVDYKTVTKACGYGLGSSPMVKIHDQNPCDQWDPKFSRTLEKVMGEL